MPAFMRGGIWGIKLNKVDRAMRLNLWDVHRSYPAARTCSESRINSILSMETQVKNGADYTEMDDLLRRFMEEHGEELMRMADDYISVEGYIPLEVMYSRSNGFTARIIQPETFDPYFGYDSMQEKVVGYIVRRPEYMSMCNIERRLENEAGQDSFTLPYTHLEEMRLDAGRLSSRALERESAEGTAVGLPRDERDRSRSAPGWENIDPLVVVLMGFGCDPTPDGKLTSTVSCYYPEICRLRELEEAHRRAQEAATHPKIVTFKEPKQNAELTDEDKANQYGDLNFSSRAALAMQRELAAANSYNAKVFAREFQRTVMGNGQLYGSQSDLGSAEYMQRMSRMGQHYAEHNVVMLDEGEKATHIIQPVSNGAEIIQMREYVDSLVGNLYGVPQAYTKSQGSSQSMKGNSDLLSETKGSSTSRRAKILGRVLTKVLRMISSKKAETPYGIMDTYKQWLRPKMRNMLAGYLLELSGRAKKQEEIRQERAAQRLQETLEEEERKNGKSHQQGSVPIGGTGRASSAAIKDYGNGMTYLNAGGPGNGGGSGQPNGGKKRPRSAPDPDEWDELESRKKRRRLGIDDGRARAKQPKGFGRYSLLEDEDGADLSHLTKFNAQAARLDNAMNNMLRQDSLGLQLEQFVRGAIINEAVQFLYFMPDKKDWLSKKVDKIKEKSQKLNLPAEVTIELREYSPPAEVDAQTLSALFYSGFIPAQDSIKTGRSMLKLHDGPDTARANNMLAQQLDSNRQALWAGMQKMVHEGDVDKAMGIAMGPDPGVQGAQQVSAYANQKKKEEEAEAEKKAKEAAQKKKKSSSAK